MEFAIILDVRLIAAALSRWRRVLTGHFQTWDRSCLLVPNAIQTCIGDIPAKLETFEFQPWQLSLVQHWHLRQLKARDDA